MPAHVQPRRPENTWSGERELVHKEGVKVRGEAKQERKISREKVSMGTEAVKRVTLRGEGGTLNREDFFRKLVLIRYDTELGWAQFDSG